ncbi:hemerythrin domain-containing protein [Cryptosporangium minutisporangium]|uniref:Hemerythrin-like domain-containing protein n=1 Tax=Cryptosporangium minutisporangium TaxID=113569 RepID=A0ABP6T5H4_9ACTN
MPLDLCSALADVHATLVRGARDLAAAPDPASARLLTAAIRAHLAAEDDVVWPVLIERAGAAVELAGLCDDHRALHAVLDRIADESNGPGLGPVAVELRDLLEEHVAEEEQVVFAAAVRYLTAADHEYLVDALLSAAAATTEPGRRRVATGSDAPDAPAPP